MWRKFIYLLASGILYFIFERWLTSFRYEDYKDYLNLISTVSGMVFTIMGIWIAFLYPNAMNRIISSQKLVAADFSESRSDTKRLESIVGAVMTSALVMLGVLFITLAKLLLQMTPIYITYRLQFKSVALSALVFITLLQLEAVIHVVLSNVMFINDLHYKREGRQADDEM